MLDPAEAEVGFYEGDGIESNNLLGNMYYWRCRCSVFVGKIARDSCRCGRNRNQEMCACQAGLLDDRWEALKNYGK